MAELVEHVGAVLDKVIGPDMIALLRLQPNARSVGQPEPAPIQVELASGIGWMAVGCLEP
jgi:hypothetical protein